MGKSNFHLVGACTVLALASGCTAVTEPYYLGRMSGADVSGYQVSSYARPVDRVTKLPLLHVCYSKLFHSTESIRNLVSQNCDNPRLTYNGSDPYSCSLIAPIRASFRCDKLSREAIEARPNLRRVDSFTAGYEYSISGGPGAK